MHGRGLLIILSFVALPYFVAAQDSSTETKDEFAEFEEIPNPSQETEKPTVDVPTQELESTPLPPVPEEPAPPTPQIAEPEPEKPAEPEPLPTAPEPPAPVVQTPHNSEEPDLEKEARFHRIYQKYNSVPYNEKTWQDAVSVSKRLTYDVQPKDTLWDISETLFNDSKAWPKLWANNSEQILNPHEIEPNLKLSFFPGSLIEVPALIIAKEKAVGPHVAVVDEGFPMPSRVRRRLKKVPDSLPIYRFGAVNEPKPKIEVDDMTKPVETPLVFVPNYLEEFEPNWAGEVKETEEGVSTAADNQYIIVQIRDNSIKHYYTAKEVDSFRPVGAGKYAPPLKIMELQGEIQLLENVDPSQNIYRAVVRRTISPVMVGSKLMPGMLPRANIRSSGLATGLEASIIAGGDSSSKKLFGPNDVVYIDAGVAQGIREGQTMNIFTNLKKRNPASLVEFKNRLIGKLKILKTTENFATAYVLQSIEDIWQGDTVGGAAQLAVTELQDEPKKARPEDIILPESDNKKSQ